MRFDHVARSIEHPFLEGRTSGTGHVCGLTCKEHALSTAVVPFHPDPPGLFVRPSRKEVVQFKCLVRVAGDVGIERGLSQQA